MIKENIKFIRFDDNSKINDFDIGSYLISEFFSNRYILFLITCRPNSNNWLKINHYENKSVWSICINV